MATKKTDLLASIPAADVVRRRLDEAEREASKLRVLLETAEKIERAASDRASSAEVRRG